MGLDGCNVRRLGEINYNTFGSEMKIIRCNGDKDIKEVANEYKEFIPHVLYDSMINYQVEIIY